MGRLSRTIILILLPLTILGVGGCWMFRMELAYLGFRDAVDRAADRYGLPRSLLAALVWQESRFQPLRRGKAGEIGLAQVLPSSAREWAVAERADRFCSADLFDARTNAMAGAWYLARARYRWRHKADPLPYALAQYNAGASNAVRWDRDSLARGVPFVDAISYPGTKRYVRDITRSYENFGAPWRNWLSPRPRHP